MYGEREKGREREFLNGSDKRLLKHTVKPLSTIKHESFIRAGKKLDGCAAALVCLFWLDKLLYCRLMCHN